MFARKTIRAAAGLLIVGAMVIAQALQAGAGELRGASNSTTRSKQIPVLSPHQLLAFVPVTSQR
jgi:hypothetical protein